MELLSLRRSLGFEALLLSLPARDWQMGILSAIVVADATGAMAICTAKIAERGAI